MNEEDKVECTECGYIHAWSERKKEYDPEYGWTSNFCPKCGEESYYPVEQEKAAAEKENIIEWELSEKEKELIKLLGK